MNKTLLKSLLAVPTFSRQEYRMIAFIATQLRSMGIPYRVDLWGNVYATKGEGPGFYPLVCAHTDTVHIMEIPTQIIECGGKMCACGPDGMNVGCGGDDKAGIFVCLEMLRISPRLKAAFWASEEIGCLGSLHADPEFCADVGYCIEFDSPNGDIVSFSCDGVQLFDDRGPFAEAAVPIMDAHGMNKWQYHPFTDVAALRRRFTFECLNLPCGYHCMHTEHEYVALSEVKNAISVGMSIIERAANGQFLMEHRSVAFAQPVRNVTRLMC